MKNLLLLLVLISLSISQAFGQASGNRVYGNTSRNYYQPAAYGHSNRPNIYLSDSTILLSAQVLLNFSADQYIAVFSIKQEETTSLVCNQKINKRINDFIGDLAKINIVREDISIDMVSQIKVLDFHYSLDKKIATQYLKGIEIQKNIILKFDDIDDIDDIVSRASKFEIYDLIKVDYVVLNTEQIYDRLFKQVSRIIRKKRKNFSELTGASLKKGGQIYSENFSIIYPQSLYKGYVATETSESILPKYNNRNIWMIKNLRRSRTLYYDQMRASGFDKVLNPDNLRVGVQAVLEIRIKYEING